MLIKETEKWLTAYSDANPTRSIYAFCIDPKHPGYFYLCFKANKAAKIGHWFVRIIPNGFEFLKEKYPNMRDLCNGFKTRFNVEIARMVDNAKRDSRQHHR